MYIVYSIYVYSCFHALLSCQQSYMAAYCTTDTKPHTCSDRLIIVLYLLFFISFGKYIFIDVSKQLLSKNTHLLEWNTEYSY